MNKIILITFAMIFIMGIGMVSAFDDFGYQRANTPYNINLGCSYNSTYCDNTAICNISIYANGFALINNQQMTSNYPTYNYTLNSSTMSYLGTYYGRQMCYNITAGSADYGFQFEVNPQGVAYNTTQGITYFITLGLLVAMLVGAGWLFVKTPSGNNTTEDGQLISINKGKYIKAGAFMFGWLSIIGILYFAWNISYGILQFTELANWFLALFRISVIGLIFITIMFIPYIIYKVVMDKKLHEQLKRGLTLYEK